MLVSRVKLNVHCTSWAVHCTRVADLDTVSHRGIREVLCVRLWVFYRWRVSCRKSMIGRIVQRACNNHSHPRTEGGFGNSAGVIVLGSKKSQATPARLFFFVFTGMDVALPSSSLRLSVWWEGVVRCRRTPACDLDFSHANAQLRGDSYFNYRCGSCLECRQTELGQVGQDR